MAINPGFRFLGLVPSNSANKKTCFLRSEEMKRCTIALKSASAHKAEIDVLAHLSSFDVVDSQQATARVNQSNLRSHSQPTFSVECRNRTSPPLVPLSYPPLSLHRSPLSASQTAIQPANHPTHSTAPAPYRIEPSHLPKNQQSPQ